MWGLLFLILVIVIGVVMIGMSKTPKCTGWCCQPAQKMENTSMPVDFFELLIVDTPMQKMLVSGPKKIRSTINVLRMFIPSLTAISVDHQPIASILKLAGQRNEAEALVHQNSFEFLGLAGEHGNRFELFATIYLSQALLQPNAIIVLSGVYSATTEAFHAWFDLMKAGVIHWQTKDAWMNGSDCWVLGRLKGQERQKSMSEYLNDIMCRFMKIDAINNPIQYYVTSRERETEIYQAYKADKSFMVDNVTSAIHGAVLKSLFPSMQIVISSDAIQKSQQEIELYPNAIDFFQRYIL